MNKQQKEIIWSLIEDICDNRCRYKPDENGECEYMKEHNGKCYLDPLADIMEESNGLKTGNEN